MVTAERKERLQGVQNILGEVFSNENSTGIDILLAQAILGVNVEVLNSIEVGMGERKSGLWAPGDQS